MKSISFTFFIYLSCILVAALENAISYINEQDFQVIELFENEKLLLLEKIKGSKGTWNRRINKDSNMNYFETHPGVDYFRKDDYENFFPEGYPQDNQWVEEISQKRAVMAQLVKRQAAGQAAGNDEIKEEQVLGLIVKKEYEDDANCKKKLEEYCAELKKIDGKLENVDAKVKGLCEDGKQGEKCKSLKERVKKELDSFKTEVEEALNNLTDGKCRKCEEKCVLLEEADPSNLIEKCVRLRDRCYGRRHQEVTKEIFFRALEGKVDDTNECKRKMKGICQRLSGYNDKLMFLCLNSDERCEQLKKSYGDICKPLGRELEDNELVEKCQEYLEKCYFYGSSCKDTKCDKVKNKCKGKGIEYEGPKLDFSPVEEKPGFLQKIEIENLYKRLEAKGIIDGESKDKTLQDLILLLIKGRNENTPKEKCKGALKGCESFKHLDYELEELCGDKNKNNKCKELVNVDVRCMNFKLELYLKGLSTEFEKNKESDYFSWGQVSKLVSRKDCGKFESECFHLEGVCTNGIGKACENVRVACYKKGQDRMLNRYFQEGLKGLIGNFGFITSNLEKCQKSVVGNYRKLKEDKRYFAKCHQPNELCLELLDDISAQSEELEVVLNSRRDFPSKEDCVELKKKCDDLKSYSYLNHKKCDTLNRRCEYLKVTEELRKRLLKRGDDALRTQGNCTAVLKKECEELSRRGKEDFSVSCALREETCSFMVKQTGNECLFLKNNMDNEKILSKIEKEKSNERLVEKICTLFDQYCHQYMENCPNRLKKGDTGNEKGVCLQVKEKCKPFLEKLKLEDELTHELKGNLGKDDECRKALGNYCTKVEKARNQTLNTLCKNTKKEELCKKLVEKVKGKCPTLKNELNKEKDELKKKKDEYEKAKQEAEKFAKEAKLPLRPEQANVRLVRKTFVNGGVSEAEKKAFDRMARALELYLELKEKCKALKVDCGFRKDCPEGEPICKEIDKLCEGIQALKVTPQHTVTLTTTKLINGGNVIEQCTFSQTTGMLTSTFTLTSTVTLTSTQKCKPMRCTTDSNKETETQKEEEEEEVKPNEGMKIIVPEMIKIMLLGVIVMGML
ncbi:hypothetical protein PNEG_00002 [Pneumocystis murina B123]|uniref:Major surface glycoprotein 2 C-terminal domain-containing protein n=1 Tax=Pneumocystis murina (strain B123) TaxID=1069680 RepID=M7NW78_PNEMU|nr:hypothetical protein PNEG_00002 [Pneumocystis murina B123]EMR11557.1 hypothetical protein PNEG_00002 [Pneumocystis murina B123]